MVIRCRVGNDELKCKEVWAVDVLASVLLPSLFSITTLPGQYYYPPSSLNTYVVRGIGHALVFEHSFCWAKSLLCITGFET